MKKSNFVSILGMTVLLSTALGNASHAAQAKTQNQPSTQANSTIAFPISGSAIAQTSGEPNPNANESADLSFMMTAAQGGMSEVELGKLAQQKASSPQVKQFAQRMVQDHDQANAKLMQIFQQKGLTPPKTGGEKYTAMLKQLEGLSGTAFDREYMSLMVKDHTEDVANFQQEATTGKDPAVKAWASQTLPTLKEHLQQSQTINQSIAGSRS